MTIFDYCYIFPCASSVCKPQANVGDLRGSIEAELDKVDAALRGRARAAEAKSALNTIQEADSLYTKVRKLVSTLAEEKSWDEDGAFEARARALERAASELSKLGYIISSGKDIPRIDSLNRSFQALSSDLLNEVDAAFVVALTTPNDIAAFEGVRNHSMQMIRHAYCTLGAAGLERASRVVRESVVLPLVTAAIGEVRFVHAL